MPRFSVGCNMPGYLPYADPYVVEGAESAKSAMIDELARDAEHAADGDDHEIAKEIDNAGRELADADVSQGWQTIVGGLCYFITPTEEPVDEDL